MKLLLKNAHVVTPSEVLEFCDVLIEDQKILEVKPGIPSLMADDVVNLKGAYLLPGFIDIHADMIEGFIEPRTTALMDFELGLKEAEKHLLTSGITTIYHSISLYCDGAWEKKRIRQAGNVKKLSNLISEIHDREHLIHHRLHLRYEIDNIGCYDDVISIMSDKKAHLLSFMDHSPGQGQYRNLEIYKHHLPNKGEHFSEKDFLDHLEQEKSKETLSFEQLQHLVEVAAENNISVASHDDDTSEKIALNCELGVKISEFPITMETALAAKNSGLLTVLGAPNILLGGSHSGNLSAAEAIKAGACHILCSDYYPSSLLHAVFSMVKNHGIPLQEMVNMVTENPAKAVGIDSCYGSIAAGKYADLLVVKELNGYPVIEKTYIHGKAVASLCYRI